MLIEYSHLGGGRKGEEMCDDEEEVEIRSEGESV
jgi:hypothetical protein